MKRKPVYIDTDIGTDVDDAIALAYAVRCPDIDLVGVGTVAGNVSLRTEIARKVLGIAGITNVPVASGCEAILLRTETYPTYGHEGEGILTYEEESSILYPGHAVDLLVDLIKNNSEKITIVAIGPLTNIALAIIKDPWILERIDRIVLMGGSIYPEKLNQYLNLSLPEIQIRKIENNFNVDPEAAEVVLNSGIPITIIPIEITVQTFLTKGDLSILEQNPSHLTQMLSEATKLWIPVLTRLTTRLGVPDLARPYLHDPLAVAATFSNEFLEFGSKNIYTHREEGILCTLIDESEIPNVEIAVSVDASKFRENLIEKLIEKPIK